MCSFFFFSSRRRHTRFDCDWSSDVCSSDLACTNCQGYGRIIGIDMEKVIPNRDLRLDELPITPWNSAGYEDCYEDLEKAAAKYKLRLDVPIKDLTAAEWDLLYNGRSKWYGIK